MAKRNNASWHDWAIILLIVLAALTNLFWLMAVRDLNERLDTQAQVIIEMNSSN